MEYDAGHFGYPMYGNGVGDYESDSASRKLEGGSKWVEIEYSPDTEKTLLNESKASSIEKWVDANYSSDNDKALLNDSKNSSIDKDVNEDVSLYIMFHKSFAILFSSQIVCNRMTFSITATFAGETTQRGIIAGFGLVDRATRFNGRE